MKILQEKSDCCGAKIIRFGGKRRQCIACKKTWRVHPAKRGRKVLRRQRNYLDKVFRHDFFVKQLAEYSSLSVDAIYKRFNRNLAELISGRRTTRLRGQKLILLIDAEWQYFKGRLWTMYFISVKSVNSETVTILDPLMRPGKENSSVWKEALDQLPQSIKNRVVALVSDGIRGIETIAEDNNWVIQRCHFHLLLQLQKRRGKRAATPGRLVREEIYCSVRLALSETSKRRLNIICKRLAVLAVDVGCPKQMKRIVRDFLRRFEEFRNYLNYPKFNLPVTTNVMESLNSFVRRKAGTVNSPQAWLRWTTAATRLKSKFICK
jgi:hypothetical protein